MTDINAEALKLEEHGSPGGYQSKFYRPPYGQYAASVEDKAARVAELEMALKALRIILNIPGYVSSENKGHALKIIAEVLGPDQQ